MNESQLVRALSRLNVLLNGNITASGTSNTAAVDIKDYEGSLRFDFSSISMAGAASANQTIDVAVRSGVTTAAMSEVTGGAFAQAVSLASNQTLYLDTRSLDRYIDVAYTVAGTTVGFASSVVALGIKRRNE